MKIALTMIVKNEAALLGQALRSAKELADDIIVVDTGSTDRTVEIAKRHGAQVFEHPWEDSFSIARNQAFEHARELEPDWFFILDADEEMYREDIPRLKELMRDEQWVAMRLINVNVFKNGNEAHHHNVRAVRNMKGVKYTGRAHNYLHCPKGKVLNTDIRIRHYGYDLTPEYMQEKYIRSAALMAQDAKEYPFDARIQYHTALMFDKMGVPEKGEPHALAAIRIWGNDTKRNMLRLLPCLHLTSAIYLKLNKHKAAERYCRRALSLWPEFADSLFVLGMLLAERPGKEREAVKHLNRYIRMDAFLRQNPQPGYSFQCLGHAAKAVGLITMCNQRMAA